MAQDACWHSLKLKDVYKKLNSSAEGLSNEEADKRFILEGPNELPEAKPSKWWVIFFHQFKNPLIYILMGAMAVVLMIGEYIDGAVIAFVLLFNAVIGAVQEGKAQNTINALKKFVQTYVFVLRGGKKLLLPDTRLVPGDVVLLGEGDKVPADCRIISANNLKVDQASLTGESVPVRKRSGVIRSRKKPLADRYNMIFKGTGVVGGTGKAIVVATGLATEIGKISQAIAGIKTEIPFQASIRRFSYLVIGLVSLTAALLLGVGFWVNGQEKEMFLVAISLAVSVIPEGLPIITTLILAFGVLRMAKHQALVKRLQAVEALGETEIIAIDKTGTITKGEMVIQEVFTKGMTFKIKGSGYRPFPKIKNHSLNLAGKIAALCSNAYFYKGSLVGDPTEAALLIFGKKAGFDRDKIEKKHPLSKEIPFDFKNKFHATYHRFGRQYFLAVTGAPENIMALSKINSADRKKFKEKLSDMTKRGLRVVAFAYADNLDSDQEFPKLKFEGFFGIWDALREEASRSIKKINKAGMKAVMITGDHKLTAVNVAKCAGIFKEGDRVLTGQDLETMSNKQLADVIDEVSVFARVTPDDKMKIIKLYHQLGKIVAMTGDGVNDAASLVAADLGVAMGKTGTQVAQEAADIVLLNDDFSTIVVAVKEGRHIYNTVKKVILYLFSTSLGELFAIVGAVLIGWPLLLAPSQIIWLNLVTDSFGSTALAWEPKNNVLLKQKPQKSKYFLDKKMVSRSLAMGGIMMISALLVFSLYFQFNQIKAMTMALTVLAIMQWLNTFNVRSQDEPVIFGFWKNKALLIAVGLNAVLQMLVIYWAPMQVAFRTTSLNLSDWALAVGLSLPIVIIEELRKIWWKR